jgi:hypothetical protein
MKATRIELQKSRVVQRRNLLKKFAKAWGEHDIDTVCAVPPAQAVSGVRLNSNHRGPNVTATACAALPAQPGAPQKPKPDADGLIYGTNARVIRIRRSRSQTPRSASATKSL